MYFSYVLNAGKITSLIELNSIICNCLRKFCRLKFLVVCYEWDAPQPVLREMVCYILILCVHPYPISSLCIIDHR